MNIGFIIHVEINILQNSEMYKEGNGSTLS